MADVVLFPSEVNPADVRLAEGGVAGPATYTVFASATAVGAATAAATYIAGATPPAPLRSGRTRPIPRRPPVTRRVAVTAAAICIPRLELEADHAGRRQHEDELLLLGAF